MNIMIGLGIKNSDFESILWDNGYHLDSIGGKILNRNGEEIHPDITYKSHAEKSFLLIDCKSGTLQERQAKAYKELDAEAFLAGYKPSIGGSISLSLAWSCSEQNLDKVKQKNSDWEIDFPVLFVSNDNYLHKLNKFASPSLENIFSKKIELPEDIPTSYYPFSKDDDDDEILPYVFSAITALCNPFTRKDNKFTLVEILREAHPYYDFFEIDEQKEIKNRVGNLIDYLAKNELIEHIRKYPAESNTWQLLKGVPSFGKICQKIMENYKQIKIRKAAEEKQKQMTLMEYT